MKEDAFKIATFNICGWKSATKKGLLKWIEEERIDVLAIQELRTKDVTSPLDALARDYSFYFNPSRFHGTVIITREKPLNVARKIGCERFDKRADFSKPILSLSYSLTYICLMEKEISQISPISWKLIRS